MRKIVIAILVGAGCMFANNIDSTKMLEQDNLLLVTNIKAEFLGVQQIDKDAQAGSVIFGDNNFGVTATKGDLEVVGSINLVDYPNLGVEVNKAFISKGIGGETFNLTVGYKDLPYGYWLSNCVNYPLVRSGDYNPAYDAYIVKTKATQIDLKAKTGIVTTNVAGYVHNGEFNSAVIKTEANFNDVIVSNASVKIQNADTVSMVLGTTANIHKFQVTGVYSRGFTDKNTGAYTELSFFPTDRNVTAIRADLLMDDMNNGLSSYGLSTIFNITENLYVGSEYTLKSEIVDSKTQTPTHSITALIGVEF